MALEGGEGSASRPGRSLPPGKTRYPLYRRLDGPQGRYGQVRKISFPLGFDPRTVQPVASRYTDYATQPTTLHIDIDIFVNCNWGDTQWQQYSTHLHTNNTQNNTINNFGWKGFWDSNPEWSN
jgi:hypothetical protein